MCSYRWYRFLIRMATAFIVSINTSNTIARAATTPFLYSGAKLADAEKIRLRTGHQAW